MSSPSEFLPTGDPIVGRRRSYGELPYEERLGVGILGLHEGHTMLVALRSTGLCRAVAGCDLAEEKRVQAANDHPGLFITEHYDLMLQRPEVKIVAIYTPDPLHADHVEQAFEAGKDVICTKPLINDPADSERLRKAAEKSGRRLMVGQSTRFGESFQRQRERFQAGELGEIEVMDAHYNHRMDWYYRKSPWTAENAHWAFLGLSHPIDLVHWYLGPIQEVHAYATTTAVGTEFQSKSPDAIVVNLLAKSGRIARVLGNYGIHELGKARSLIECLLMGSRGTSLARYPDLRFSYTTESGDEVEEEFESMAGYYYRHELRGMHYGEFANYADYFAGKLLSGEPNSPDLDEGLRAVAIMHAVAESIRTGRPIAVN
jgi:predicted dehydrogenase